MPSGQSDLDVSVALANDPGDVFVAELVDPNGQTVSYSTNVRDNSTPGPRCRVWRPTCTRSSPMSGHVVTLVEWLNPVSGLELSEPFTGTIAFNQVNVTSNLPNGTASIGTGTTQTYHVNVTNSGNAPEAFFVDPRLNQNVTINLLDQNFPPDGRVHRAAAAPGTDIPVLRGALTDDAAAGESHRLGTRDLRPPVLRGRPRHHTRGEPRVSTTGSIEGDSANVTLTEPEISSGFWLLDPEEIGPYPATGAPTVRASAILKAVTQAFDPSMTSVHR